MENAEGNPDWGIFAAARKSRHRPLDPIPKNSVIVSVHVPKSAGTSFRIVLDALYGSRLWYDYDLAPMRDPAYPPRVPTGIAIIHGHFPADAFDEALPHHRLITWVRHPVERVVSSYHHCLRHPDLRDDCCRVLYERRLSLIGFAELEGMRNLATRYFAAKPFAAFTAVGVTERFAESLAMMAMTLGWPELPVCPRVNTNPARRLAERYTLPAEERDYIGYLNARDLAWYQQAVDALDAWAGSTVA